MSIFIDSYDGNSDVWDNFFLIFDYFWKDCSYARYLVTNEKDCLVNNLKVIKTGQDIDWFSTTLTALRKVNTKYVWLFLDDYFLSKNINNSDIEEILDYMDENNVYFYRLSLRGDLDRKVERHKITNSFFYAINLQPAIWNREQFISFLESLYAKGYRTPWEFENYFISHFKEINNAEIIDGVIYDTRDLMGYQNAIIQGKWVRHVLNFYRKKFGIIIDIKERKVMPLHLELFDFIKRKSHLFFDYNTRNKIKDVLLKFGIRFMSH